jgi:hypothetical protein
MPIKSLFLIFIISAWVLPALAQNKNPFKSIGKRGKVLTLSDGKYDEFFEKDSLERVGSVIVNRYTRKIENLLAENYALSPHSNAEQSRFLSVDPLTKKFPELSPYQYASNRPIDGKDLDGLEWQSSGKNFNYTTGKYEINYTVTLSLNNDKNILSLANNKAQLASVEKAAEQVLSKLDAKGTNEDPIISTNIIFTDKKGPFNVAFFNAQTIRRLDPSTGRSTEVQNETYAGKTQTIGQTQANFVFIPLSNEFILDQPGRPSLHTKPIFHSDQEIGRSFSHELGHTAGLFHVFPGNLDLPLDQQSPFDIATFLQALLPEGNPSIVLKNLMNSPANPVQSLNADKQGLPQGTDLTPEQRKKIEATVQEQQPKSN